MPTTIPTHVYGYEVDHDAGDTSHNEPTSATTDTLRPALIVGAGPAGASLACFLATHGIISLLISAERTNAPDPRAHITNVGTMECFRELGIEEQVMAVSTSDQSSSHTRWQHSMAGEEYARLLSWSWNPARRGEWECASPCQEVDCPQSLLEPILVRHAALKGWDVRFGTEFVRCEEQADGTLVSTLRDKVLNSTFTVHSKYLFGADGGRSQVARMAGLPFEKKTPGSSVLNILVTADLSHLMANRQGTLHWTFRTDIDHPTWSSGVSVTRMVKPWTQWMFIIWPNPTMKIEEINPTAAELEYEVRSYIGDNTPFNITGLIPWTMRDSVAEYYSKDNIFCLGDAVHRHPPVNGLGSNTSVQDAYNLAWKVGLVEKGLAGRGLLDTYSFERQPVGRAVVTRANEGALDHIPVWKALGQLEQTKEAKQAAVQELGEATEAGRKRRQTLEQAVAYIDHEVHALGIQIGFKYDSRAIITSDEDAKADFSPRREEDPILYYVPSTNPSLNGGRVSTVDIAGHGRFTLFTGIGGEVWKKAASKVNEWLVDRLQSPKLNGTSSSATPSESAEVGLIKCVSVGFRNEDYTDPYFAWSKVRGVEESGCVLVRPDRFVAWRAMALPEHAHQSSIKEEPGDGPVTPAQPGEDWAIQKLKQIMQQVLALQSNGL